MSKREKLRQMSYVCSLHELKSLAANNAKSDGASELEQARLLKIAAYHKLKSSLLDWEDHVNGSKLDPILIGFHGTNLANDEEQLTALSNTELRAFGAFERLLGDYQTCLLEVKSSTRHRKILQADFNRYIDEKVMSQTEDRITFDWGQT